MDRHKLDNVADPEQAHLAQVQPFASFPPRRSSKKIRGSSPCAALLDQVSIMTKTDTRSETSQGPGLAQVLYDGQCPLCLKSVGILKRLDWRHRLSYLDVRTVSLPACKPPLERDRLLEEMHLLLPDGKPLLHGFRAFRWMAWRLPLLWPVAPFMYLPGMERWGQKAYLWVARNRFRLVPCHGGVCSLPPPHRD
jgi:predicted DCC family thiol-disulfide oxidoreductase YuxK